MATKTVKKKDIEKFLCDGKIISKAEADKILKKNEEYHKKAMELLNKRDPKALQYASMVKFVVPVKVGRDLYLKSKKNE